MRLKRDAVIISAVVVVALSFAVIWLQTSSPWFESHSKVYIKPAPQISDQAMLMTESEIIVSDSVLVPVIKSLGLDARPREFNAAFVSLFERPVACIQLASERSYLSTLNDLQQKEYFLATAAENLAQNIDVDQVPGTDVYVISVRDHVAVATEEIANSLSRSILLYHLKQQLAELQFAEDTDTSLILLLHKRISEISSGLSGAPLTDIEALGSDRVKIIERASVPRMQLWFPQVAIIVFALIIGLIAGGILALFVEIADKRFKYPKQIELILKLANIGTLPSHPRISHYRMLANQLYFWMKDKSVKTLMFAAAARQEGVSTLIAKLAESLSENDHLRILIVDANLKNPHFHRYYNLREAFGLMEVLEDKIPVHEAISSVGKNLDVMVAGRSSVDPVFFLKSQKIQVTLKDLRLEYDIVLVDSPELGHCKDGVLLAHYVDGTVLVLNTEKSSYKAVKSAIEPLMHNRTNILGFILLSCAT
ncbi:MAG TPA: hypothetical protein PKL77_05710 [Candidatus Omnitrophota bacterium]|mgnify:CR=1 FL=1|nr:hypothetical protein [Candidatus Omnitrophota bacterium]HPT08058.1 hypothetical protein [Candidatus Omnitrophota bacterium]